MHKGKLFWVPAHNRHEVRCILCGETLTTQVYELEFDYPGECKPPETLGVHVQETIQTQDAVR